MAEYYLECITCGRKYKPEKGLYWCSDCGSIMGTLQVIYDYESLKKLEDWKKVFSPKGSIVQFEKLLPVGFSTDIDRFIGGTPLFKFRNKFGIKDMMIKFDGISMSGSYKDRASIIAVNKALEEGYDTIFCASTGNAASSLGLLSAHTALETYIFVPATIPGGKLAQLVAAGAKIISIETTYDQAFDISLEIGLRNNWYCRNSAVNPYLLEGKKTGAYEILVQNKYEVPDYCIVAVGDGTVISSLCKGFSEFYKLGLVEKTPKVIGVQAEGAATVKHVFEKGRPFKPIIEDADTVADSICVGNPRDVIKACSFMEENGGYFESVSDEEILAAIAQLAGETGVFAEPAGAAPLACLKKLLFKGVINPGDDVCLMVTGNGLKDVDALGKMSDIRKYTVEEAYKLFEGVKNEV
ncbi:L-threonine synthase [Dethiosulfatibacter aminovorans DSM 17477]|uniref:Threonine synthase n=1 Tax=Dethiosulfatibacter aminovorans DSM 17477 TaxID=1121476 RepID=A0A1M6HCD5_9FIRM|nr:threonine synthase [Dethiosulfatibacter aminovorans]SHJ19918.1 L-threonine synthase [Dethiosulfatibacter aminovorans DSM 17477]